MAKYRLTALFTTAILTAFANGVPAQARDSADCLRIDPPATATEMSDGRCVKLLEQVVATSNGVVAPQDRPDPTSIIAEPIARAQQFAYRFLRPETPSGDTIVLLHGSGGDETSMFKLATRIAPHATLLGVRGRVVQRGVKRWYTRISPTEFDQEDIRKEAQAFVDFLKGTMAAEKLDLDRTTFIGYSNGANLIAAMTLLHPNLIHRAVLLRAMPVLHTPPEADLRHSRFLTVAGKMDKVYAPFAPALESLLRDHGATVESYTVATGHLLGDEDVRVISEWLSASNAIAAEASQ